MRKDVYEIASIVKRLVAGAPSDTTLVEELRREIGREILSDDTIRDLDKLEKLEETAERAKSDANGLRGEVYALQRQLERARLEVAKQAVKVAESTPVEPLGSFEGERTKRRIVAALSAEASNG